MLLPYLSLSILILLLSPPLYQTRESSKYLTNQLESIFITGQSCHFANPLWFVFVLYMLSILFYFTPKNTITYIGVVSLASAVLTQILPNQYFAMATVCACLPFFSLGYILKKHPQILTWLQFKRSIGFMLFSVTLYLTDRYVLHHNIALRYNELGNIFIFYGAGIAGCLGLMGFFQNFRWDKIQVLANSFAFISRNSLIILGTQYFILQVILKSDYFTWLHSQSLIFIFRFFLLTGLEILLIYLFRVHFATFIGKEKIPQKELFSK